MSSDPISSITAVLTAPALGTPLWAWALFLTVVIGLLALDLGLFHRGDREIGIKESLRTSAAYIAVALLFDAFVWSTMGDAAGVAFLTGYFIEKTLSLDNIFVISLIFSYFAIPRIYQHRVLFWGILGVLIMRALLIGVGTALVHSFSWMLPAFGLLLIVAALKLLFLRQDSPSIGGGELLFRLRSWLNVTPELHGKRFFVRAPDPHRSGRETWWATPLFLALILVEMADAVFALESVPAILAITQEPYIVYTSNIFAVLGLRALYFALAAMIHRFAYLKHTLGLVLMFVGGKIIYNEFGGHIEPAVSLIVVLSLLGGGTLLSIRRLSDGLDAGDTPRSAR